MFNKQILSKVFLGCALILMPILATGCAEEGPAFMDEAVQEKRVGILKSLGGISVGDGTHLLEMNDGSTIRLRSVNIDLENNKYLNKNVEVRGPITDTADGKKLMEVVSIDLIDGEDEKNDQIQGNETEYKNADLGFKISYLDNWKVEESENKVVFTAPPPAPASTPEELERDTVTITILQNPDNESLNKYLKLPNDNEELAKLGYYKTSVGVDYLDALKKESEDLKSIDVYIQRFIPNADGIIYYISFKGNDHQNTFYTMLASYQPIGLTVTEDKPVENTNDTEEPDLANNPKDDVPVVNNAVETPAEVDEPEVVTSDNDPKNSQSSTYGLVAQYIGETINNIAPEASDSGSWTAYSFEFVDPNYVYTVYGDGSVNRRVLITYDQTGSQFETNMVAYFKPGETTSWTRVSGENPVESSEKTIITLGDNGAQEQAVVKEGYSYFESLPYDFKAQYPSNWYYSGNSGGPDVSHHYGFSNEPVEDGNELVSIDIVSGSLPTGGSPISVGSHNAIKVNENGNIAIYIQRDDGMLYKVHGKSDYESYIIDIAASIQAN